MIGSVVLSPAEALGRLSPGLPSLSGSNVVGQDQRGEAHRAGVSTKACIFLLCHFLFGRLLMQLSASRNVSSKISLRRTLNQYDILRARWPYWSASASPRHVVRQETRIQLTTDTPEALRASFHKSALSTPLSEHTRSDLGNDNSMPAIITTSVWHSNIEVISGMLYICSPKGVQTGTAGAKSVMLGKSENESQR